MPIARKNVRRGELGPEQFQRDLVLGRYCFEQFMMAPLSFLPTQGTEGLVPLGTSLANQAIYTGRHTFEYAFAGDVTDAFIPTLATEGGYNWLFTDVTGSGVEVNFGGTRVGHPRNFTPKVTGGGGEDWFARILIITDDASGMDVFFGFRKVADYVATLTEYSDVLGLRLLGASGSTDAAYSIITSATDYTSTALTTTGLEDATAVELEVRAVGGSGFAYVNGVEVAGWGSKTFVADQVMSPVIRILQATDVFAQMKTLCYEAGPLAMRQEGTLLSLAGSTT